MEDCLFMGDCLLAFMLLFMGGGGLGGEMGDLLVTLIVLI